MKKNMSIKSLFIVLLLLTALGCTPVAKPSEVQNQSGPVITGIRVEDNSLIITSDRHFAYTLYSGNDPYKVSVDIPDMSLGSFSGRITSDKAGITEVIPQQMGTPVPSVRIEIVLQSPSQVVPEYSENTLTIKIAQAQPPVQEKAQEPAPVSEAVKPVVPEEKPSDVEKPAQPVAEAVPLKPATEIKDIEIQKTVDGVKVIIKGNGSFTPNVFPLDERIVVDVPDVELTASVPTSVISPLRGVRAGKHKDKIRLVLDLKEQTNYDVATVGNSIVVALAQGKTASVEAKTVQQAAPATPVVSAAAPASTTQEKPQEETVKEITSIPASAQGEGRYTGKKISLDFQDADIGPIFRLLADVNGYNLVLDPSIRGRITIKLMNVPWDQAMDIILNTFNYAKSIEGNILWIAPASMFAKIAADRASQRKTAEEQEELTQEIIRVNYSSAGELKSAIDQGKLLSPRGSITIDNRMNTLIIKDTQTSINKMKDLIKIMDVTKPQVMIEAKIVQVNNDYSSTFGIRWGGNFATQTWPNTLTSSFGVNTPVVTPTTSASSPGASVGMTLGYANTAQVSLSLSALESISKAKTLSNPKVITMDNEAATIQQGSTFFIETVSQAGTQTQQQQATLSLNVTPKITPDGYVQLKVSATDNSLVSVNPPVVDTKSLNTQALVKNGETLVLGGIYVTNTTESEDQVPVLSKIPLLGRLFKVNTTQGPSVKELLIFITPNIINRNDTKL